MNRILGLAIEQNQRIISHLSFKKIHMKISLELLHTLDAIDRHGSFSAAAEAMHRVPSALSHAIAKQENDLGIPLFLREGRRVTLTEAGQTLLDEGRHLLRAAGELERRVQRIATGWEAELRIAVDMVLPIERLYPLLNDFYATNPPTRISLRQEALGGSWDALMTDRADLVIGAPGDMPARSGLSSRLICHHQMHFVVAPHHPLANYPEPFSEQLVRQYRGIVISDTSRELMARSAGLPEGQDALKVPDMLSKASAQIAGLGIGHLPGWVARPAIAAGTLIEKKLSEPRPAMPYHIAWRNRHVGQATQWFLNELEKTEVIAALTVGLD